MEIHKYNAVFTPNDQPTISYVSRSSRKLEIDLQDYLQTKNIVVSVSGPSKTGKTVLLRSVLDTDYVISLNGAAIRSLSDLWEQTLNWMELPTSSTTSTSSSSGISGGVSGGGEAGIPLVAKGKANANINLKEGRSTTRSSKDAENKFQQIVNEIANSEFVIFIDDFHYIPEDAQIEIAKVIKALAENGVKIVTASVPHRSEDVVRANPELRGRLAGIDIPEWSQDELCQIGKLGFCALNCSIPHATLRKLADEAHGSPQLMQSICYNFAREVGARETAKELFHPKLTSHTISDVLEQTSNFANSAKLIRTLHSGPKVKGQPRMQYTFTDGTTGDIYRAILLAISIDPVSRNFTYDEMYNRIKSICVDNSPTGQSISQSLSYMVGLIENQGISNTSLEWDEATLHIVDPYLAFYLRNSKMLETLGEKR